MEIKDINPFVRKALVATLSIQNTKDTCVLLRTRDARLFYILSDVGSMVIEGRTYELHYGSVILFPGGTRYIWKAVQETIHYIAINFDYTRNFTHIRHSLHPIHAAVFGEEDVLESLYFDDAPSLNGPIFLEHFGELDSQFRRIASTFYMGGDYCEELLSAMLKALLLQIVKQHSVSSGALEQRDNVLVQKLIGYIQLHYMEPLTNEKIAEEFHINPVYMNRIFKRQTGTSIHAFLLKYRLNVAMTSLRSGNEPVCEIAHEVGFSDHAHFNKMFKKYVGVTPNRYRGSRQ